MSNWDNIIKLAEITSKQTVVTEDSAALAFAEQYRAELLFDHDAKSWFCWSGNHWQQERTKLAFAWARDLIRDLTESEAIKIKALGRKTAFTNGVEKFAQTDRTFAITTGDWNRDPYLLATPRGTVELRTGKLRPANPADRINKISTAGPAPIVDCPRWLAFLEESTGQDLELIAFLQRWAGYCLTGDIREHALVFCTAPAATARPRAQYGQLAILGDYATTARHGDLHRVSNTPAIRPNLPCCAAPAWSPRPRPRKAAPGPRPGSSSSPAATRSRPGSCAAISSPLNRPSSCMVIGNHEPTLRNVDDAARRRFNVIPFTRKPALVDKQLEAKLGTNSRAFCGG